MKVFYVIYWACGQQRVSVVVAKDEKQAEDMVNQGFNADDNFELDSITECDLKNKNIIHTEVIEIV
jgi:hypothetical protein